MSGFFDHWHLVFFGTRHEEWRASLAHKDKSQALKQTLLNHLDYSKQDYDLQNHVWQAGKYLLRSHSKSAEGHFLPVLYTSELLTVTTRRVTPRLAFRKNTGLRHSGTGFTCQIWRLCAYGTSAVCGLALFHRDRCQILWTWMERKIWKASMNAVCTCILDSSYSFLVGGAPWLVGEDGLGWAGCDDAAVLEGAPPPN